MNQSIKWQREAAELGYDEAQYMLGFAYYFGRDHAPQDYAEAGKWFRKAADQGNSGAQYCLGCQYDDGEGVPQDYIEAHKWLNLAASNYPVSEAHKRDKAFKRRDEIAAKMTPAQIAEAQRLAKEWKPTLSGVGK